MKKVTTFILAVFVSAIAFGQTTKTSPEKAPSKDLAAISLAHDMAQMGYDTKQPIYLVTAAQTLIDHPINSDFTKLHSSTKPIEDSKGKATEAKSNDLTPKKLLADAKEMAKGDVNLLAMITATEAKIPAETAATRGALGGPASWNGTVFADSDKTIYASFKKGQLAEITIQGDGKSDLDLYVYDEDGNMITSDNGKYDECYVSWTPKQTLAYKIVIKNGGTTDNDCMLVSN
ncbi:MAG: hypothetical protein V2A54_05070 [Bacteroidota bacterium]